MKRLFLAALVLAAAACSSEADLIVQSDPAPAGPAISLRPRVEGDSILVDVVANDLPSVSGVALRIDHPKWARYERRDVAAGWESDTVHRAKSTSDHDVAIVDVAKGAKVALPSGQSILTTLRFKKGDLPDDGAVLGQFTIVAIRSEVRDASGTVVKVGFAGATLRR